MAIIANSQQSPEAANIDPRGDVSGVDPIRCTEHVRAIETILNSEDRQIDIADRLRAYIALHLQADIEMYICVNDQLAAEKIVSKAHLKNWLSLVLEI